MNDHLILVTGATGRLGKSVLATLGGRGVAGVRRRGSVANGVLVTSDGVVDPTALDGFRAIINCAGRVDGAPDEIEQANVVYPVALARAARAAGVHRFVQVSSFSVFGRTERIDAASPIAPASSYGRSKLSAERALAELNTADFTTAALRLPFMFSAEHPALLGDLVSAMLRVRVLPVLPAKPSRRSMITYAGAAGALIALASSPDILDGALAAADPRPLELATVARAIRARLGRRVAIVPVPAPAAAIVGRIAPGIADRLFRSSVLDGVANILDDAGAHPVEAEMLKILDELAAARFAGQGRAS